MADDDANPQLESLLGGLRMGIAGLGEVTGKSANLLSEALARVTATLDGSLTDNSTFLINALDRSSSTLANGAKDIGVQVATLTTALSQASIDLGKASDQSAKAARKLNNFTFILAIGTLLLFIAACFQAFETKRQVDLASRQVQLAEKQLQQSSMPPNESLPAPKR